MKDQLHITLIQADLVWEDKVKNRVHFEQKIKAVNNADVIILPEMFTTGFSMNPVPLAEKMDGVTVSWMKELAISQNSLLIGSVIIEENSNFYNRLIAAFPDGTLQYYDKRHLFTLAKEHHYYTAGTNQQLIEYEGWKIFPLVCYDLRFPVWSRNTVDYDVLVYVASWPKQRIYAWDTLLKARAIENMAFTIGVNRVGIDANGFEYPGHSVVLDAFGNEILSTDENQEQIKSITLSKRDLDDVRNKLQFLRDMDTFSIE